MKKGILIAMATLLLLGAIYVPAVIVYGVSEHTLNSKQGLLMEYSTGEVLFEKNSTEARPIASMVKIMTLLCVYDNVAQGKITLDDVVTVSANAAGMGGSQAFLDANSQHKASELVKTIIIASANDSCVALAEHICGSVEGFVAEMNNKAEELRLVNTQFVNCTGLPAAQQFSCAADVAVMMRNLIKYQDFFRCSRIWMEDYVHPDGRITGLTNTNRLVRFYEGCDGGKTGFTNEAMHCLCATATRNGTRYIAVVVGAPDSKTRFNEVSKMLDFAFANYEAKTLADQNYKITIPVRGGKAQTVDVSPVNNLTVFGRKGNVKGELIIETPDTLPAPIVKGDIIGYAYVKCGDEITMQTELVAQCDVESKSYFDCLREIAHNW